MADKNKQGDYFNRPEKLSAWSGFKQFLWNPETKQFMGRTSGSWGRILLFYIIFYIALAAFFMGIFAIFYSTLLDGRPKYELKESIIGTNPGLGFRPMPPESNVESTLIWYEKDNSDYWVDEIEHFLKGFSPQDSIDRVDCKNKKPSGDESCKINLKDFAPCTAERKFGYPEGRPCIFLKLNKIYNWLPEYYNQSSDLSSIKNIPESLRAHIKNREASNKDRNVVWVTCEGENPADIENLGNSISYYTVGGEQGFLGNYFPFMNTKGYLQPLVAVQFSSVKPGVLINIECKAWAKNINHDRSDRRGSVHFELMIDEPKPIK